MSSLTRIFYYDKPTGSYTGQGVAEISPRDGKPMVPSNATLLPPGNAKAKWNGKAWVQPAANKKVSLPPVPPAPSGRTEPGDLTDERPVVDASEVSKVVEEAIEVAKEVADEKTPDSEEEPEVKSVSLSGGSRGRNKKKKANRP